MTIGDRFSALLGDGRGAGKLAQAIDPRDATPTSEAVALYGPNGDAVARFIRRVELLTVSEINRLVAARGEVLDAAMTAAIDAVLTAEGDTSRFAEGGAAMNAAMDAKQDAEQDARMNASMNVEQDAVLTAAVALVVWDVLPRPELAVLVGPWRAVFGEDPGCVSSVAP
jgi:hypothetical protein